MFERLRKKIEGKRSSKSLFWKALVLSKDFLWRTINNPIIIKIISIHKLNQFFKRKGIVLKDDEWYFACFEGIGDTYVFCALINKILKHNGGKRFTLFIKKSHLDILKLFNINSDKAVVCDKHMQEVIADAVIFNNSKSLKMGEIVWAHPRYFNPDFNGCLIGETSDTFTEFYKSVFNIPLHEPLEIPVPKKSINKTVVDRLSKMSLKKGKSVIVIPKTTGIFFEDKSFWKNLVLKLKEAGFDVYTSLDNCNNLSMIEGSKPIIFSLLEAIAVSEYAGHVVSIRSGLCDLISSSKCSIHVLYPEKTTYKFFLKGFSLKEYFTRKLYEYEIDSGNSYKVIEEIVKNMIKGDRKSKIP